MINVTVGEQKPQYPKLMIANKKATYEEGMIVLFECDKQGVVIKSVVDSDKYIGYKCASFNMDCFDDFNYTITLQNA